MPTIEDIIMSLSGAKFFSTIDLRQGFHQLEMDEESRDLSTIAVGSELYRYKRLMFGLVSASEIYQAKMRAVLSGLPNVQVYIDDIVCYGKTEQEHDEALLGVLQRLKESGLTVKTEEKELEIPRP